MPAEPPTPSGYGMVTLIVVSDVAVLRSRPGSVMVVILARISGGPVSTTVIGSTATLVTR